MKAIVLFIALLLNSSIYAQAQEVQLKSNDWYVYKVVLSNQVYLTPNNNELINLGANFTYSPNDDAILLNLCTNSSLIETIFIDDDKFTGVDWVSLAMLYCVEQENLTFNSKYNEFFIYNKQQPMFVFNYQINNLNNNIKELIITNELGDKAYFYSTYLSSPSYVLEKAKIYPNPVKSILNIELPAADYQNVLIDIYDITSKKLKSFKESWQENISLNIESLPAGNYLLELKIPNEPSRGHFVKMIKE
ncbi:T9SS type A sorting domain-containing protein [Flavobacterium dauae]|uniref:T9SS type A sorting domain-containing protein n=1 Tax=Flavobacterium dauae TaxID=1563479 RepID=UPI00101B4363|nr:T9SS type A sorting domain-containing protein [Flavobacterium dauae]WLD24775.1 T9SS type A sorting domain-containing protein [Flavobacterium dauae]